MAGDLGELIVLALLPGERADGARGVQQEPSRERSARFGHLQVADQGIVAPVDDRRAILIRHRMIRVEEILTIVALRREARREQREDDRIRVLAGGVPHFGDHRLEQAKLAVREIVAADANRAFVAIDDGEAEGFQRFDLAFAREPFAHLRELAEPARGFVATVECPH